MGLLYLLPFCTFSFLLSNKSSFVDIDIDLPVHGSLSCSQSVTEDDEY
jgi:hypothetical protein